MDPITPASRLLARRITALQRSAYAQSSARMPTSVDDAAMEETFAEIADRVGASERASEQRRAELQRDMQKLRAMFDAHGAGFDPALENPGLHWQMTSLAGMIHKAAKSRLREPPASFPVLASLPSGSVNCMAVRFSDTGDHVVFFERGLFVFLHQIAKALAGCLVQKESDRPGYAMLSMDPDDVRRNLDRDKLPIFFFATTLATYLSTGDPIHSSPAPLAPVLQQRIGLSLLQGAELFLMGHEYGHVIAKHLESGTRSARALPDALSQEVLFSWKQEIEADAIGLQLSIPAFIEHWDNSPEFAYAGAEFFLSCAEMIERCASTFRTGQPNSEEAASHPPPSVRREVLRRRLAQLAPREAAGVIETAEAYNSILEELWSRSVDIFRDMRKKGFNLAQNWRR